MRLSQWRAAAPNREAGGAKVAAVVDPVLVAFGAEPDPHCWVAWGDEPAARFAILVPTEPGLIHCFVRVNVPGEGPRATTKLIRWNRVAIGELGLETSGGHRLLSFQIEQQVLRGVDDEADDIAAFALRVIAAIDGRPLPPIEEGAASHPRHGRKGVERESERHEDVGAEGRVAFGREADGAERSGVGREALNGALTGLDERAVS